MPLSTRRRGKAISGPRSRWNEGEIARLPEGASLIPGMPADAFIQTGERSPIDYLARPLMDFFARVFREGVIAPAGLVRIASAAEPPPDPETPMTIDPA